MTVRIQQKSFSDGQHTVVAIVETDGGTYVGPHVLDLPEDASDEDITAAIDALFNPPKPVVKRTTKKAAPVVEAPVDSSEATNG